MGAIVSLAAQGNAIAHSVNRASSRLLDQIVHRCEFQLYFSFPAHTIGTYTDLDGGYLSGTPSVDAVSWTIAGFIDPDLKDVASSNGTISDANALEFADGSRSFWRMFWLRALDFGGAHCWFLEETDALQGSLPIRELIHSAWVATRRTALRNTPRGGTTGDLLFTPVSAGAYAAWWPQHPEGDVRAISGRYEAYGPLHGYGGGHIYVERPSPSCDVTILSQ